MIAIKGEDFRMQSPAAESKRASSSECFEGVKAVITLAYLNFSGKADKTRA